MSFKKMKPKVPKGTRDVSSTSHFVRDKIVSIVRRQFELRGASPIDTPVFELKNILISKYGEEEKLIYDLQDQGGEICSLRYDLTIPFARHMCENGLTHAKLFRIGKVFRRDNPAIGKGRYREFMQADFDIAGTYGPMIADAECIHLLYKVMKEMLSLTSHEASKAFVIKLNHRKLLESILLWAGIERSLHKGVFSAIDKLDKLSWSQVAEELVWKKRVSEEQVRQLGRKVQLKGTIANTLMLLEADGLGSSALAQEAFAEIRLLQQYLNALDPEMGRNILFEVSLARGLDYYTGIIFEVTLPNHPNIGSVAAGGRYDTLIGSLGSKQVPSVGLSVGIDRMLDVLLSEEKSLDPTLEKHTTVLVASVGDGLLTERMKMTEFLRSNGISAEYLFDENPKALKQMEAALKKHVSFIVWIGEEEMARGKVKVKTMNSREETEMERKEVIEFIREKLEQ